ncbi:MAG: FadR family transcriptional regulator [Oscillospiraceae bacterium]|jgi:DNA-binding FadR family transcriptional regulator|nr:FadR family transcriptional regulator [Oscillospiraceae bacterium]MCI1990994.1 FadR family transcriptional regulator [Oscillospiraceae bacterium]
MGILTVKQELSEAAAKGLRQMIVSKGMKAGDRLPSESELGILFGVSRSTVREAVKLLTAENVVEIRRGKGTFVARQPGVGKDPLGLEFTNQTSLLTNLMETRMMIEPQIASAAAQRATKENMRKLAGIIRQIQEAGSNKANHTPYDVAFHTAVAECTQNDVLQRIMPIICESIQEGYLKTVNVPGSYERAIQSHIRIYEAIVHKDSQTAKTETEKHLKQTQEDANIFLGGKT